MSYYTISYNHFSQCTSQCFFSSRCGNHGILVDPLRRSWAWQPSVSADVRKAVDVGNFRMNQLEMSGNFRSSGISNNFFFRKNITENLSCQTGSPSAVLMKNWVSETLATFSSSWSSTSSALWSSVNKTQSCRISGTCWGFLHCPRHTCLIGRPKPGVGKTRQNFLLVFLNRSPYAESCRTFSPQLPRRPCTAITSGSIGTSLTSFASAAWDSRKHRCKAPLLRCCKAPLLRCCCAVPGHYKWHRVNSGSFHRWRCHRPGHPVESQFY